MDQKVEDFFRKDGPFRAELLALRAILLDCPLQEVFKWRGPCYTYDGGNVATVWAFKDSCGLGFFKGILLKDPDGVLVAPGENSRSVRMFRFADTAGIAAMAPVVKSCILEAIEIEKAGRKVDLPKDDFDRPQELIDALEQDCDLSEAFDALTPGRQRGYCLHFAQAKQSATRVSRIEKSRARILAGKGMHDR